MIMRVCVAGGPGAGAAAGAQLGPVGPGGGGDASPAKLGRWRAGRRGVVMDGLDAMSISAAMAKARPDAISTR